VGWGGDLRPGGAGCVGDGVPGVGVVGACDAGAAVCDAWEFGKAAERLYTELGRLYPVRIDVVVVTSSTLGWRVDESLVVEVGDCLGNG